MELAILTCKDLEKQGLWDTDECCASCHEEDDEEHEMHGESWEGSAIYICTPLFEHLFCGAERRISRASNA